MVEQNPYKAPSSQIDTARKRGSPFTKPLILSLIAAQLIVSLLATPETISDLRYGYISPIVFLSAALAAGMLGVGGLLVVAGRRSAMYIFLAAALLGLLAFIQWRPPFVATGIGISAIAVLVSRRLFGIARTAP